ncbi:hypothetical protein C1X05_15180 [Laceyella sacchari]|nr:hypothetical protein C1X05_15180 [Laceyella sacchari]
MINNIIEFDRILNDEIQNIREINDVYYLHDIKNIRERWLHNFNRKIKSFNKLPVIKDEYNNALLKWNILCQFYSYIYSIIVKLKSYQEELNNMYSDKIRID